MQPLCQFSAIELFRHFLTVYYMHNYPPPGDSTEERCIEWHSAAGDQFLDEPGAHTEQDPLSPAQPRGPAHFRHAQSQEDVPCTYQL